MIKTDRNTLNLCVTRLKKLSPSQLTALNLANHHRKTTGLGEAFYNAMDVQTRHQFDDMTVTELTEALDVVDNGDTFNG